MGSSMLKDKGKLMFSAFNEKYLKPIFGGPSELDEALEKEEEIFEEEEEMRIFAESHRDQHLLDQSFFRTGRRTHRDNDTSLDISENDPRLGNRFQAEIELKEINH